jgi:urate oxidase
LSEVDDRIFSTSVDLLYTFASFEIAAPKDEKKLDFVKAQIKGSGGLGAWEGIQVSECAREITLSVFATDESASVQVRPARTSAAIVGGTDPERNKNKNKNKNRRHCTRWEND